MVTRGPDGTTQATATTNTASLEHAGPDATGVTLGYEVTRVRGLSVDQRRFLGARLQFATDAECARALGLHPVTPRTWHMEPMYAAVYDTLWDDGIAFGKAEARRLLGKGWAKIDAMLDAQTVVRTKDGVAMDKQGNVIMVTDWQAVGKGAEMLLRANGQWQPEPQGQPQSEGAAVFGEMAAILKLRREQLEAEAAERRRVRAGDASSIEGAVVREQ